MQCNASTAWLVAEHQSSVELTIIVWSHEQLRQIVSEIHQLVDQCLADDEAAILALVRRFRNRVYSLCFRMTGQRQDAEDIVQETFVRVIRSLKSWDKRREFEPWLLQIAANRCRTFLAKQQRRPSAELLVEQTTADEGGEATAAARQLGEELQLALGSIRADWSRAFILFHQKEFSYGEIAEQMGVPLGTVKTWVHRARREIITRLQSREVV